MSVIIDFFNGEKNNKGRTLDDILSYTDYKLEAGHDLIQWLFPLHEKSLHSVGTPVLKQDDIEKLNGSIQARDAMLDSLKRFRAFFGLDPIDNKKIQSWCNDGNHNLLRITRIIRSLRLFGLEDRACRFHKEVKELAAGRLIALH